MSDYGHLISNVAVRLQVLMFCCIFAGSTAQNSGEVWQKSIYPDIHVEVGHILLSRSVFLMSWWGRSVSDRLQLKISKQTTRARARVHTHTHTHACTHTHTHTHTFTWLWKYGRRGARNLTYVTHTCNMSFKRPTTVKCRIQAHAWLEAPLLPCGEKVITCSFDWYLHKFALTHIKHDLFKPIMPIQVILNYTIMQYLK